MNNVQKARIGRTKLFFEDRPQFESLVFSDIALHVKRCDKSGKKPAVRMNGTSDIMWEGVWEELFDFYDNVQFYDYTKHYKRCLVNYSLPDNYHLTFSRSESNDGQVNKVLKAGKVNVAVVFDSKNFPSKWRGYPTYSADDTDLRFLDPNGGHVGCLYAKGDGKKDSTGFVVQIGG